MSFDLVPLGVLGGLCTGNLSSYLIQHQDESSYVLLDAGTLLQGIQVAQSMGSLPPTQAPSEFLSRYIVAAMVTHVHLDHVIGIAVGTTELTQPLPVYGLSQTMRHLAEHVFNDIVWPDLIQYRLIQPRTLQPHKLTEIAGSSYQVQAFPLRHANVLSTAFFIHVNNDSLLFLGDTGDDAIEGCDYLSQLWDHAAPLIEQQSLKAILIEASYQNDRPDTLLFGHLTPQLVIENIKRLRQRLINPDLLRQVTICITHIKPKFDHDINIQPKIIAEEIKPLSDWVKAVVIPEQGQRYSLD